SLPGAANASAWQLLAMRREGMVGQRAGRSHYSAAQSSHAVTVALWSFGQKPVQSARSRRCRPERYTPVRPVQTTTPGGRTQTRNADPADLPIRAPVGDRRRAIPE